MTFDETREVIGVFDGRLLRLEKTVRERDFELTEEETENYAYSGTTVEGSGSEFAHRVSLAASFRGT